MFTHPWDTYLIAWYPYYQIKNLLCLEVLKNIKIKHVDKIVKKMKHDDMSSLFIILVSVPTWRLLGSRLLVLSLDSARSPASKGTSERKVNMLLGVNTHHEWWNIHHLPSHPVVLWWNGITDKRNGITNRWNGMSGNRIDELSHSNMLLWYVWWLEFLIMLKNEL